METKIPKRRLIFAAAARITRLQEQTLASLDTPLTGPQYRVLARVNNGHTSPTALARLARRSLATMSENIEGLVRRGLLERNGSPTDRRSVVLKLTPAGELALQHADKHMNQLADQILSALPENRQDKLAVDLQTLFDAAEELLAQRAVLGKDPE